MRRAKEAARLLSLYPIEPVPRVSTEREIPDEARALLETYRRRYALPEGHRLSYIQIRGYLVALHRWVPQSSNPRGILFLCHGYQSHTGLMGSLIHSVIREGYAVAAVDLPGHGLSTGPRGAVDLIADYRRVYAAAYRAVSQRDPETGNLPIYLLGTSTGCTVITDWLINVSPQREPRGVFFLSPLIRPRLWPLLLPLEPLGRGISAIQRLRGRRIHERSHRPNREPSGVERLVNLGILPAGTTRDTDHSRFIRREDPLYARRVDLRYLAAISSWSRRLMTEAPEPKSRPPLLIQQGTGDRLVAFRQNLALLRSLFPDASVHLIRKAHHDLLHDAPPVPKEVVGRIVDAL